MKRNKRETVTHRGYEHPNEEKQKGNSNSWER